MRIVADKIESKPPHGVTAAEVRQALSQLPTDWTASLETVRLSASTKSWEIAVYSSVSKRLVICSRSREKEEVFRAMIRELYLHSALTHPKPEWRSSAHQKRELDIKLAPFLAAVMQKKSPNQSPEPMAVLRTTMAHL